MSDNYREVDDELYKEVNEETGDGKEVMEASEKKTPSADNGKKEKSNNYI